MTASRIQSSFAAGDLDGAIEAATAGVRAAPAAAPPRIVLAELLLFKGRMERADTLLDAAGALDGDYSVAIAEFRQLLRAAIARRQVWQEGRPPEFLAEPSPSQIASLAALVALRDGDPAAAARHAAQAEAARRAVPCIIDGARIADVRDADDILCGTMEVLTVTGRYLWIEMATIRQMTLYKPERPRDLFWRRATVDVADGPQGEVYLPALYVPSAGADPSLALGRTTEWLSPISGLVLGAGQRMLLAGETGMPILQLATMSQAL